MMQFICYFFPAMVAVWMTEFFCKENFNAKKIVYYYSLYTILINTIIFLTLVLFFNPEPNFLAPEGFSYAFTLKYFGLSLVLSVLIPFIFKIVKTNIKININIEKEIEEKKNDKKKKKNNK